MKGLLIKDYKLMNRGNSVFNLVFIAVVLSGLIIADLDSNRGYVEVSLIAVVLSVGVRNYDVCDNGLAYLLTLPVSRREYVRETYLFSLLSACVTILAYCLFDRMLTAIFPPDNAYSSFVVFYELIWDSFKAVMLLIALLIPFYLFFGSKKRNQCVLIAVGVTVVFIVLYESMPLYAVIGKGINLLKEFPMTLIVFAASYVLSVIIMERKEF